MAAKLSLLNSTKSVTVGQGSVLRTVTAPGDNNLQLRNVFKLHINWMGSTDDRVKNTTISIGLVPENCLAQAAVNTESYNIEFGRTQAPTPRTIRFLFSYLIHARYRHALNIYQLFSMTPRIHESSDLVFPNVNRVRTILYPFFLSPFSLPHTHR